MMMIQKTYFPRLSVKTAGSHMSPRILAGLKTNTTPTIMSRNTENTSITCLVVLPR